MAEGDDGSWRRTLAEVKRAHVDRVLQETKGNKHEAARILGVHPRMLIRMGYPPRKRKAKP